MRTTLVIPGFAAGVLGFLLGWVLLGMLLMDPIVAGHEFGGSFLPPYAVMNLSGLMMSNVIFSSLIAWTGKRLRIMSFMKGMGTCLIFGFILYSSMDLVIFPLFDMAGSTRPMITGIVVSSAWAGVMGALAGLILPSLRDPIHHRLALDKDPLG